VSSLLQVDILVEQVQILDATALEASINEEPFSGGSVAVTPAKSALVTQVYSRQMASATKLALSRFFPEDHLVLMVSAAGVSSQASVVECPLHELDHQKVDHLTSVWVPALAPLEAFRSATTVQRIIASLRAPNGCPWDRKQTHATLRDAVIAEAYEVVDAIDENDPDHLAEELGDLSLLVALHSQIAEESGSFTIEDVYDHVNRKLIRRHPHVFGDVVAESPADVIRTWQGVKAEERKARGVAEPEATPFDKLPKSMPVLTKISRLEKPDNRAIVHEATTELGDRLLDAVEAILRTGHDPERELELAYRRRASVGAMLPKENR
jgi:tetrapyrrole methylase family protein/MazG family protein